MHAGRWLPSIARTLKAIPLSARPFRSSECIRPTKAFVLLAALAMGNAGHAAVDEELLGRAADYSVAPRLVQIHDPRYVVGSFSALDTLAPHCTLAPSAHPAPLPAATAQPTFAYRVGSTRLTFDDYLLRQRVTGVLIVKDGQIAAERYNYDRTKDVRMLSYSMAKTILSLAIGRAVADGDIRSLDDTAATMPRREGDLRFSSCRPVALTRS